MKKWIMILALLLVLAWGLLIVKMTAERAALADRAPETTAAAPPVQTVRETTAPSAPATEPATAPTTQPTEETTAPTPVYDFTAEEEELLLKIGMAERGDTGCVDCIALVMRTVLNRVEGPKFSSTIRGVIYAQDQFTPVAEGTFESAAPNNACREALEMIRYGWDESQGALYYEWCEGESWHSRNLNLLLQHCDTRFYR